MRIAVIVIGSLMAGVIATLLIGNLRRAHLMKDSIWVYLSPQKHESGRYYWKISAPWERGPAKAHMEFEFRCDKNRGHVLFCTWCGHLKTFGHEFKTSPDAVKAGPLQEAMEEHIRDMKSVGIL